ncbi:Poly(ADP-ribose) glycohydrolase like protein [Aduncisulcus paluster]|uniref:Poly(ADP-ribose) glycohydrolase like protein n=1 Tax=Aduncisulcus paluster TaxID=2918883 RepID=A0ABQ5KUF6_9EUKA|nr:Poly(ADP-ribose) glycohydrolase like protein [Aduncisulcus paluster]
MDFSAPLSIVPSHFCGYEAWEHKLVKIDSNIEFVQFLQDSMINKSIEMVSSDIIEFLSKRSEFVTLILPALKYFVSQTSSLFPAPIYPFKPHKIALKEEFRDEIKCVPEFFLPVFGSDIETILLKQWSFSKQQTICLVCHMFCCSFPFVFNVDEVCGFNRYWECIKYPSAQAHLTMAMDYIKLCFLSPTYISDPTSIQINRVLLCDSLFSTFISSLKDHRFHLKHFNVLDELICGAFDRPLSTLIFHHDGYIGCYECPSDVELDFAHRSIGYGPFATQEEIVFGTMPEACIAPLVNTSMSDSEACCIRGTTHIGQGIGYAKSYKYKGVHGDISREWIELQSHSPEQFVLHSVPTDYIDKKTLRHPSIMCVDAKCYGYEDSLKCQVGDIHRDLQKYMCGILASMLSVQLSECHEHPPELKSKTPTYDGKPVEFSQINSLGTGPWGCGVYGGDKQLKLCIQVLGSSYFKVKCLHYFTFGEKKIQDQWDMWRGKHNITSAGKLFEILENYKKYVKHGGKKQIFEF